MIATLWYLGGILFILVGIAVSIALHEVGHMLPAKAFGVKVTRYMVGFGPTLWSRKKGDTEYGIKGIPLGGYIAMVGMFPPAKPGKKIWPPFWGRMVEQARISQEEQFGPNQPGRNFYEKAIWKRMIIMLGGPFMNLILGVIFLTIAMCGVGVLGTSTTLEAINDCVPAKISEACKAGDPVSPAKLAGLQKGDKVLAINGKDVSVWTTVSNELAANVGKPVELKILRDGAAQTLTVTPAQTLRPVFDAATGQAKVDSAGKAIYQPGPYLGVSLGWEYQQRSIGDAMTASANAVGQVASLVVQLPQKVSQVADATFGGAKRSIDSPVSIVGIGQVAGTVAASTTATWQDKVGSGLSILASLNFALFAFNLIPILPLDGGHVAGAIYEGIKRGLFRLFRKKDPGPADTSLMVPFTTVVWVLLIAMSLLFIVADFVNPIRLGA